MFVTRSQHGVAPVVAGQLFAQSRSAVHDGTHLRSDGGVVDVGGGAGGSVVGSDGEVSSPV